MKSNPFSDEAMKRMTTLSEEMRGQTDRGAAIVGAALVEESMTSAIEAHLHSAPKAWDGLFGSYGPMSTLSAKIDLARLLGIVTDTIRSDLRIIRDVRNEFAHRIAHEDHEKLSFKTTHIRDKCLNLRCIAHEGSHKEPRLAFVRACAILSADFELVEFAAARADGAHVYAEIDGLKPRAVKPRKKGP